MQFRALGTQGLKVSALSLGCMSMSGTYGPAEDEQSIRVIHKAIALGVTMVDTSDAYGKGHNEELVGKALKGRRQKVVVATKFGNVEGGANGRPDYVHQACEASLKRLGVDVIDLYYQHRVDPSVPIEDTVGAMGELVTQGKVRALGLSEAAPATVRRAADTHPIAALQSEFSIMYQDIAAASLPVCREKGIAYVAYAPLGRSLLGGRINTSADLPSNDRRLQHPRFQGDNLTQNLSRAAKLKEFAADKGVTLAQLVLAWLLAQGKDIIALPGTKHIEYLEDNLGALEVQLTGGELAQMNALFPSGTAAGARYPEKQLASLQL
ncbi:MAG: aldo/keto reductase [Deltaproteobacteria bacterium]|nr:aldo/keto reductase [Deltaproteobacteria bacterium]